MNDLITTLEDDEPYLAYFKIDPSGEVTYYARGIFD